MNARVTTGGRVVIPVALRRQLHITPGTRIHIELDKATQQLVLTPITPEFVNNLYGSNYSAVRRGMRI